MMELPSFAYTIVILAPFLGENGEPWRRGPFHFDPQEPEKIFESLRPSVFVPLARDLCPAEGVELAFSRKKDFTPDGLLSGQPYLSHLKEAVDYLADAEKKKRTTDQIRQGLARWPDLPDLSINEMGEAPSREVPPKALENLLSMVELPDATGTQETNDGTVVLKRILDCIFAEPSFRKIETAWLGLHALGRMSLPDCNVKLLIVPTGLDTFDETLEILLPQLVQDPPSLLLVDLPFGASNMGIQRLSQLGEFARTLLCPALSWITADFFHIDSWAEIDRLSYLPHHLDQQVFAKFKSLRQSPDARWLGLLCNRSLIRYPYGKENSQRLIDYFERNKPWGSPVWAAAGLIMQRVNRSKWPTRVAERRNNYLEDQALDMSRTPPMAVECQFSEDRVEQFARCGIMALSSHVQRGYVYLGSSTMVSADIGLDYQSLVCLVSRFTLWCRDNFDEDLEDEAVADALRSTWRKFHDNRRTACEDMPLTVDLIEAGEQRVVRLQWLPASKVLPSKEKLVLELPW